MSDATATDQNLPGDASARPGFGGDAAVGAMHEAVICCDRSLAIRFLNPSAERLSGWSAAQAIGMRLPDAVHTLDRANRRPRSYPSPEEAAHTGGIRISRDSLLISRTGEERLVSETIAPLRDTTGGPCGLVIVLRDVTEKRPLQQQAIRASALESLGLLAGGIAHDFNNLLTAILGNISLARHDVPGEAASHLLLDEAETACVRARDLTRQLLTFAAGGAPARETTDLRDLARQADRFLPHDLKITLSFDWPDDARWAAVDRGQMHQVFSHLFANAEEAMTEGGRITVSARMVESQNLSLETQQPGPHLHITVADTGPGIPPDHLPRVFDPYFTTKRGGTGLGLALVHSIVQRHGGTARVESAPGRGTSVHVLLPATQAQPTPQPAPQAEPAHGNARILVMDDESAIRALLGGMLRRLGYTPDTSATGEEALAKYAEAQRAGQPFDLVIMDLTIPDGMGGVETMRGLLDHDPAARGIVSSGYSNDPVMADYQAYGFRAALRKPYRMEDLAQTIQNLLAAK